MKFEELDVVRLTRDFPEHGLKNGDTGTVVMAFRHPDEAYTVEFGDEGETPALEEFGPDDLELVHSIGSVGKP
ncbi:MAG: DUF4926 domain-containing protein [Bacillota bacterium]